MDTGGFKKIDPSAKKVWVINGIIFSFFFIGIAFLIFTFVRLWYIPAGASLLSLYITAVHPFLEYKQWSYKITETSICYNHGIYTRKFTIIPVSRMQHLEIKQGPVLKRFKLSNIEIFTAGQAHQIEAILSEEAEEIVESINKLIMKPL